MSDASIRGDGGVATSRGKPVPFGQAAVHEEQRARGLLSFGTESQIAAECPEWYQRFMWAAFFTGARRGELLSLTRKHVNLRTRIISLRPDETKEGKPKRISVYPD